MRYSGSSNPPPVPQEIGGPSSPAKIDEEAKDTRTTEVPVFMTY